MDDGLDEIRSVLDMREALSDDDSMMDMDAEDENPTSIEIREELFKAMQMQSTVAAIEQENKKQHRNPKHTHNRIRWGAHVDEMMTINRFESKYRMSLDTFNKLVKYLLKDIQLDETKSMCSTSGN